MFYQVPKATELVPSITIYSKMAVFNYTIKKNFSFQV